MFSNDRRVILKGFAALAMFPALNEKVFAHHRGPHGPMPFPLGSMSHRLVFNKYRVYTLPDLYSALGSSNKDFIIFSSVLDDWEKVRLPEGWVSQYSHMETFPILQKRKNLGRKYVDFSELLATKNPSNTIFVNGDLEKLDPLRNYMASIGVSVDGSNIRKINGYKKLGQTIDNSISSMAIGFRGESFENKELVKIRFGDNKYLNGVPVRHTLFFRKNTSKEIINNFTETIQNEYLKDLKMGSILLSK